MLGAIDGQSHADGRGIHCNGGRTTWHRHLHRFGEPESAPSRHAAPKNPGLRAACAILLVLARNTNGPLKTGFFLTSAAGYGFGARASALAYVSEWRDDLRVVRIEGSMLKRRLATAEVFLVLTLCPRIGSPARLCVEDRSSGARASALAYLGDSATPAPGWSSDQITQFCLVPAAQRAPIAACPIPTPQLILSPAANSSRSPRWFPPPPSSRKRSLSAP